MLAVCQRLATIPAVTLTFVMGKPAFDASRFLRASLLRAVRAIIARIRPESAMDGADAVRISVILRPLPAVIHGETARYKACNTCPSRGRRNRRAIPRAFPRNSGIGPASIQDIWQSPYRA
jgi:hypothetical protein